MNPLPWLLVGSAIVAALVLFSCTSNTPHRTCYEPDPAGDDKDHAVIEATPEYKLGFVEFDDQGWFWNDRQLAAVRNMIKTEALAHERDGHGIVVIVFVHGWKHNAAHDDDNVEMFRGVLKELNETEQVDAALESRQPRPIVGVYGGWRGLSATWEPFKEMSFWDRKNTAQCVGHGALTELLTGLEDLQQDSNRHLPVGAPRSELIIVGHSFGGAAVYSALSQILTERFMEATRTNRLAKPVGDLVILLNPAFEAARHYSFNDLATTVAQYPAKQRPIFGVFTSKGDWATHYAFKAGRFFSTLFDKDRPDKPQGTANRTAIGWFSPFITHDLHYNVDPKAPRASSTFDMTTGKNESHGVEKLNASAQNVRSLRAQWETAATSRSTFEFGDCALVPRDTYKPLDPLLIVSVDSDIMSGHNDIANRRMLNFLREFILFSRPNSRREADPE